MQPTGTPRPHITSMASYGRPTPIYLSLYLSIYLSIHYLSIYPSTYLSIYLPFSLYLSVPLSTGPHNSGVGGTWALAHSIYSHLYIHCVALRWIGYDWIALHCIALHMYLASLCIYLFNYLENHNIFLGGSNGLGMP